MTDLRARKRLGQHFLHDPAVIARILDEIAPAHDDRMVEIGGGLGALTRPLLDRVARLDVIETDPRLVAVLRELAPAAKLTVHHADALRFDFATLATDGVRLRVAGNLPYNISTPILFHLLKLRQTVRDMHLMLQKEVVERMVAEPGTRQYGRLTVMLSAWTDIEPCFEIGPGAFRPPPKVRSTLVRVIPRPEPRFVIADEERFRRFVALLFSMRRKTIRRILKLQLTASRIEAAGFDPSARPGTLSPEELARLSELTS